MAKDHSLFLAVRGFLTSYVTFNNPVLADICALWVLGTHVFESFDSFGYIVITARTKRAGKSVLAELMALVSYEGKIGTSMTAAVMRRLVNKGNTIFFDESESLNSESASLQREYLNVGYRAGQSVFLPDGQDDVVEYKAYSPKGFVLIGDVNDTLRDRSINIEMVRAKAPKVYRRREAEVSAEEIIKGANALQQMEAIVTSDDFEMVDPNDYELLQGREAEIWTAVFTLAKIMAPSRYEAIVGTACDLAGFKQTVDSRKFSEIRKNEEKKAGDAAFSERAIIDLLSVFHGSEKAIFTDEAIERMKAINAAPWRTYRGNGLTPQLLSELLQTHANTKSIKLRGKVKRGFQRDDVAKAAAKLTHKPSEV